MISDEELAIQMQTGNEASLESIVKRYHGPIHAYMVRMGGECHIANDLTQEVFIKVCRNIQRYKNELPFRPWIFTIAANTYKDYLKKAYVARDLVGLENLDEFVVSQESSENNLLAADQRDYVLKSLNGLQQIYREVVILRYYQDLKLNDIAQVLQIPVGTVKSRLSSALQQLRILFAEEV